MKDFIIDDITWNDLDLDEVYKRLNTAKSSVGSEYLKFMMKTLLFDEEVLKIRAKRINFFQDNKEADQKFSKIFKNLGRTKKVSFLDYIFRLKELPKKSSAVHFVLIILLLASIAAIFVKPAIGIIALAVMIGINIALYFKFKASIEGYFICIKYLVSMVNAARAINASGCIANVCGFEEIQEALKHSAKTFAPIRRGSWLITNSVSGSLIDVLMDYVRMIFHVDLIKFNSMKNIAVEHEDEIMALYYALGEIEADMCVAKFRDNLEYYSEPIFYDKSRNATGNKKGQELVAQNIYHPLIKNPVSNTIAAEKSVLLTGSNASGKSTFLKTVAINQIFAQTLFTCTAKRYISTFYKVLSSMALNDNLLGNESYFIVEIKSLKRIFDELGDVPVMCFIDEVLRGTNTIERISASSRLLEALAKSDTLCFAATHDIELTELLKNDMDNFHFAEKVKGDDVEFDYTIQHGAANTSNAIKLMAAFGFDKDIVDGAERRAETFRKTGSWQ